ncbi:MAG: restriction endonuclease subunit S [Candidatus Paceibacterota bacterium]|jgi:type I restriction enzyme S subunit
MKNNSTQKNIPSGWKILPIGKHIKLQGGNAFSASNYVAEGIPLVRIGNVGKGDFVADDFVYISKNEHENNEPVHLRDNDILMGMTGELGKVARIKKHHLPALLNQRVGRVLFKDKEIDPDFTFQIFLSDDFKSKLEKYFIGAAQKNISSSQVESVEILLPPINEQQKIAEILGAVDEDIAKTQEVIEATEKLKRGLMQQLFTRGIGHTKFKETKIGNIPLEWEELVFGDVVKKANQGVNTTTEKVYYSVSGISVLRSNNIYENYISYSDIKYVDSETFERLSDNCKPQKGDILYCNIGSAMGSASILERDEEVLINWNIFRIQVNKEKVTNKYLAYFLNYSREIIRKNATRSTMPFIPAGTLMKMGIAVPKIEEQKQIAEILSAVDEKISVNKKLKEKLTLLKKGLMQDLLSGSVRTK